MQLPAGDELVLVSGLPPVRARKLRYFADRNFRERALDPPSLAKTGYADCPVARSDDWTGRAVPKPAELSVAATLADEGSGGLQQQRRPWDSRSRRTRHPAPGQLDLLGLGLDDPDPAIDAATFAPSSAPGPLVAAHSVNDGSPRGHDPIPSF